MKKGKRWFINDFNGQLLNPVPLGFRQKFYFGLADVKTLGKKGGRAVISSSGKWAIPPSLKNGIPIEEDIKKLMKIEKVASLDSSGDFWPFFMSLDNRSQLKFSIYKSIQKFYWNWNVLGKTEVGWETDWGMGEPYNYPWSDAMNDEYINDQDLRFRDANHIYLIDDESISKNFANAVNLALVSNMSWGQSNFDSDDFTCMECINSFIFKMQSNELFQLSKKSNPDANFALSNTNYFIIKDSLFKYSGQDFLNEMDKNKRKAFSLSFNQKVKEIPDVNLRILPFLTDSFPRYFNPEMEMQIDSVVFYLNNLEIFDQEEAQPHISYSYQELLEYLNNDSPLQKWINRKK